MAGKPQTLSPAQLRILDQGSLTVEEGRRQRAVLDVELAAMRSNRLARIQAQQDDVIAEAVAAGIPKLRIARKMLGLTGAGAVYEALERVQARLNGGQKVEAPGFGTVATMDGTARPQFSLREDGNVDVEYRGFQTSFTSDDYPEVLCGVVEFDPSAPNNWRVLVDEDDRPNERFPEHPTPGYLRVEVDKIPRGDEVVFSDLISKWWELNQAGAVE